ncbi:hypothetical protein Clacol_009692 [Clathrus columnatus]|uniref:Fungal lipase-type domain-containing protein n=1 Tax=Clathrus columnatus TaxID=1419009 RepID=A0AAV5AU48_9AGAM|nr:hypothetical protein Clacol_009692 [Clathrus columnatus]
MRSPLLRLLQALPISKKKNKALSLYERAYASESVTNFRFLSSLFATRSKYILTDEDRIDDDALYTFLSEISQYAELANGFFNPDFVFRNIDELCQPSYPLEGYKALQCDKPVFVSCFKGNVAKVQGYVALRPHSQQLVIAFSGTSNISQAVNDVKAWKITYPQRQGKGKGKGKEKSLGVHSGFWSMYRGIKEKAIKALQLGFSQTSTPISTLVLTGHSMGSTLCYLLALDIMDELCHPRTVATSSNQYGITAGISLILAVFGSPRLGNKSLFRFWIKTLHDFRHRFGQESFREYSIKAYNDGAYVLPLRRMGYRHLTESPLYLYQGDLYQIPQTECEHGIFTVTQSNDPSQHHDSHTQGLTDAVKPNSATSHSDSQNAIDGHDHDRLIWPRGGHNYYFRDMENSIRRIDWLELKKRGEENWQERYNARLKEWEAQWDHPIVQSDSDVHGITDAEKIIDDKDKA